MQTDPVTGQPVERQTRAHAAERAVKEQTRLRDLAGFIDVSKSETARQLLALVEGELVKRVEKLCHEDSEARAYLGIIKTFNMKESAARRAAEKLMGRK